MSTDVRANSSWIGNPVLNLKAQEILPALKELAGKTLGQLQSLSDQEKFDLIENIYESDTADKAQLLEKVFSATRLTPEFLDLVVAKCLKGHVLRTANEGNEKLYIDDAAHLLPTVAKKQNVREVISGVEAKTKAFLLASLLLQAKPNSQAREILASSIVLNDEIYSYLKSSIHLAQGRDIRAEVSREYQKLVAEIVLSMPQAAFAGLDETGWKDLSGFLLRIGIDSPIGQRWQEARKALFTRMPVPENLRKLHLQKGPLFVEGALNNSDFINLYREAVQNWNSQLWKDEPQRKQPFLDGLYNCLSTLYELPPPKITMGSTSTVSGQESEPNATYAGFRVEKDGEAQILKWQNEVVFSLEAQSSLTQSFSAATKTGLHEYGHAIEAIITTGFWGLRKTAYIRDTGKEPPKYAADNYNSAFIFSHNFGYFSLASPYIRSEADFSLYQTQPVEKHANGFAAHMHEYFRVFEHELAERDQLGTYAKSISAFMEKTTAIAKAVKRMASVGEESASRDADKIIQKAEDTKRVLKEDYPIDFEQVEILKSFFSEANLFLNKAAKLFASDHVEFSNYIKSTADEIEKFALPAYSRYKRHEAVQKIAQAALNNLPTPPKPEAPATNPEVYVPI
jgi:hypothetical protein